MAGVGKAGNTSHYSHGEKLYQAGKAGKRITTSKNTKRIKKRLWASIKEYYGDGKEVAQVDIKLKKKE